jgi:hypothetical protein
VGRAGDGDGLIAMGLFKIFTPKADPLIAWKPEPGLATDFDFDFDQHALCRIRLGDPVRLLWKLGPSEDKAAEAGGDFNYYTRGARITVENGVVNSFVLFWNDEEQKRFVAFSGPCVYRGQRLELHAGMKEAEITDIFGEPYWRDKDPDETILFYEFGDVEWQVELGPEGLRAIAVVTPPLLQSEERRKTLKMTRPWPPVSQLLRQ